MEMPDINLGHYPRRTFEDLRLQTVDSLQECSPAYFYVYPSHPGIVIRQLHHLLSGFMRFAIKSGNVRCLVWGRAGDIVHVHEVLTQFERSISFEIHAVISHLEDENWIRSQTSADVWYEDQSEFYAQPAAPQGYFNCVLILGDHRDKCLLSAHDYVDKSSPYLLLAVEDDQDPYCSNFSGRFFSGGPMWRAR